MRHRTRVILATLTCLLAAVALAGCSGSESSSEQEETVRQVYPDGGKKEAVRYARVQIGIPFPEFERLCFGPSSPMNARTDDIKTVETADFGTSVIVYLRDGMNSASRLRSERGCLGMHTFRGGELVSTVR